MDLPIPEWINTDNLDLEVSQEEVLLEATEELYSALLEANISKSELAEKLDKKPAFISKLFRGSHNMTLKTLAEVAFVLDKKVKLQLVNQSKAKWHNIDDYTDAPIKGVPIYQMAANDQHKEVSGGWSL